MTRAPRRRSSCSRRWVNIKKQTYNNNKTLPFYRIEKYQPSYEPSKHFLHSWPHDHCRTCKIYEGVKHLSVIRTHSLRVRVGMFCCLDIIITRENYSYAYHRQREIVSC